MPPVRLRYQNAGGDDGLAPALADDPLEGHAPEEGDLAAEADADPDEAAPAGDVEELEERVVAGGDDLGVGLRPEAGDELVVSEGLGRGAVAQEDAEGPLGAVRPEELDEAAARAEAELVQLGAGAGLGEADVLERPEDEVDPEREDEGHRQQRLPLHGEGSSEVTGRRRARIQRTAKQSSSPGMARLVMPMPYFVSPATRARWVTGISTTV